MRCEEATAWRLLANRTSDWCSNHGHVNQPSTGGSWPACPDERYDMNNKAILFALAAISSAMFALPSIVSAEVVHISSIGKFTVSNGGNSMLTSHGSNNRVPCTSVTGGGEFTTTTVGTISLIYHGCVENVFNTACTGTAPAQSSPGTVATTQLDFHLIEIENNVAGVLITSTAGHFASFKCAGGLVNRTVGGNGVVARITSACGGAGKTTHTIAFESIESGTPTYTQVTTTGVKRDLIIDGSTTGSQDGTGFIHFSDGVSRSITCT